MIDALGVLLAVATVIIVVAYIAQPFLAPRREESGRVTSKTLAHLKLHADLLAERNRIYRAIKELDFEHQTGKIADEDYKDQRFALVAQGVEILEQLDQLPPSDDDAIEKAILKVREGAPLTAADVVSPLAEEAEIKGYCPNCGTPYYEGDKFCARCGTKL